MAITAALINNAIIGFQLVRQESYIFICIHVSKQTLHQDSRIPLHMVYMMYGLVYFGNL